MTGLAARARTPRRLNLRVAAVAMAVSGAVTWATHLAAQTPSTPPVAAAAPSALDAPLFYQLLIGEIELREGRSGNAYEVILDAAKRQGDSALYQRAVEIALQARAGDQALSAVRAWRANQPKSIAPLRYEAQILVALNRPDEVADPMAQWLAKAPIAERPGLISGLPRLLQRMPDAKQNLALVERLTQPYRDLADTRTPVVLALARAQLLAGDTAKAWALARQAQRNEPTAPGPALLGLELMGKQPDAEQLVRDYLARPDAEPAVRMAYVRQLLQVPRYPDASRQLEQLTRDRPALAEPWLMLGALRVEMKLGQDAELALLKYVDLVKTPLTSAPAPAADATPNADEDDEESPGADSREAGLTQAWMLLAQAAEQRGELKAAEGWLARIDNPQRLLEVQTRRAMLLARQGQVTQARLLIQGVPEGSADDARSKLLAEAGVLREVKQWKAAAELLQAGLAKSPDDVDLTYELSMVEEKQARFDEMERLLRRVISLKPDHAHAHNALGYSLAERNVRLPEARVLIERALELAPADPFITDSLGWVAYRMGQHDEAIRLLRQAYAARPDTEIAAHLGEVLWAANQRDEARQVWQTAQLRDGDNEVLRDTLARLKVNL